MQWAPHLNLHFYYGLELKYRPDAIVIYVEVEDKMALASSSANDNLRHSNLEKRPWKIPERDVLTIKFDSQRNATDTIAAYIIQIEFMISRMMMRGRAFSCNEMSYLCHGSDLRHSQVLEILSRYRFENYPFFYS
jgi:hypothetical protein